MRTLELLTKDEICIELGARCRQLRLQANLSQQEIAQRTGASLSSVRRLESIGQATLELLVRVIQALHHVAHLQNFLIQPVTSIAEAERAAGAERRKRAGSPRGTARGSRRMRNPLTPPTHP